MLAHSPRLQFVTRLPDSPKTEAKWVVLVKGPWYDMPSSLRLPFDLNKSLSFSREEPEAEIAQGALISFVRANQSPSVVHDPKLTPLGGEEEEE